MEKKALKKILSLLCIIALMMTLFTATMAVNAAGEADLTVTSVTANATTVYDGDFVKLNAMVRNTGESNASNFKITYFTDGVEFETLTYTKTVNAGSYSLISTTLKWNPYFGSHRLSATVNRDKSFTESDYKNNSNTSRVKVIDAVNPNPPVDEPDEPDDPDPSEPGVPVKIPTEEEPQEQIGNDVAGGKPDLIVTDISYDPENPKAGDNVLFTATVKNQGNYSTPAGTIVGVRFDIGSQGNYVSWSDTYTQSIKPNQSVKITATGGPNGKYWTVPKDDSYRVYAWVDDQGRIANESDTSNNIYNETFTAHTGTAPDLKISDISYTPSNPKNGEAVTFSATIQNTGTADVPANTNLYANFNHGSNKIAVTSVYKNGLKKGYQITLTATSTWSASFGKQLISATVNPEQEINELGYDNNTYSEEVEVAQAPGVDFIITETSYSPSSIAVGDPVVLMATVKNQGTIASNGNVKVKFVSNKNTTVYGNVNTSIAVGGTATVTATWTASDDGNIFTATANYDNSITESNYGNNSANLTVTVGLGASMPYTSYEAEEGQVGGGAEKILDDGDRLAGTLNGEASKRGAVKIDSVGEYVQWTANSDANSIVIRNCIPPQSTATISLYVNNVKQTTVTLDSNHCWLDPGTDTNPGRIAQGAGALDGSCKHIYDENHKLLNFTIHAGDTIKLQKDNGDNAQWYGIDFIDLEMVQGAKSQPANLLSITQCGAKSGGDNCFSAIQTAISQAISQGYKGIWFPEGDWYIMGSTNNRKITLPENTPSDFEVAGAGMWHSRLHAIEPERYGDDWGNFGFNCMGKTCYWHDFSMWGAGEQRTEGGKPFVNAFGAYSKFENLWIEHTTAGFWCGGAMVDFYNSMKGNDDASVKARQSYGLSIKNCRIRNTGADGINLCVGTSHAMIENVHCRSNGDDCFAMWSQEESFILSSDHNKNGDEGNTFKNCSADFPWRANCYGIYGGKDNSVINCTARDTLTYCGIYMEVRNYQSVKYSGTVTYDNMTIERCSGLFWGGRCFPAIWLDETGTVGKVVFNNVKVTDTTYSPVKFDYANNIEMTDVTFDGYCKYKTAAAEPGNTYQLGTIVTEAATGTYKMTRVNFLNHGGRGANSQQFFWAPWGNKIGGDLILNNCNWDENGSKTNG
jgi:hypothetical protein